jgi:hypothetical protein
VSVGRAQNNRSGQRPSDLAPLGHADEPDRAAELERNPRTRATAVRLAELLAYEPAYRDCWAAYATRRSGAGVNQTAVAQVLAAHQWDSGEVSEGDVALPARLKHVVNRALIGRVLAPSTLRLFTKAFAMSRGDAADLWSRYTGADPARLVVVAHPEDLRTLPLQPATYETISCHEFHTIGADGLPSHHRTVHVIRAVAEVTRYTYRFDTDAVVVAVLRGGTATPMYRTTSDGLYAVDIVLPRRLQPGETASFEYSTLFAYLSPPKSEFRRGAARRAANIEINVQFHPNRIPKRIWWSIWDGIESDQPAEEMDVNLEPDLTVHRYLDAVEGRLVGFRWQFEAD